MRKKVFFTYLILILLVLGLLGVPIYYAANQYIQTQLKNEYTREANLLGSLLSASELSFADFVTYYAQEYDVRLTIIDKDGTVLADSETQEALENHAGREEVKEALKGNTASVTRYSETLSVDCFYVAVSVKRDSFSGALRLSLPLSDLAALNKSMQNTALLMLSVVLLLALLLAVLLSRHLVGPMEKISAMAGRIARGDFSEKIAVARNDELGDLAGAFNRMSETLSASMHRLEDRKTELETILSSMPSGVVAIDRLNHVLFSNVAFNRIFFLPEDTVMQGKELVREVRNVFLLDSIAETRAQKETISREGTPFPNRDTVLRITGTPLPIQNDGEKHATISVLLVIEDITKIRQLENMRRDFVSNVTHELKTPLTSIRGFVDTLQNGAMEDTAVAHRFLSIIDVESERLYRLIEDILVLSNIENTREPEKETCEVNRVAEACVALLEDKCNAKTALRFMPGERLPRCLMGEERLKEILINLMDNAIKYTEEGFVSVQTEREGEDGILITVKDSGIGMPKESLPRIFERFYRVDKGRSRAAGGTGLGLSIVKHIVELYHGRIDVASEAGKGSAFFVHLPGEEAAL